MDLIPVAASPSKFYRPAPPTCDLQDGRPTAGEIAGVHLCQRCIDVALYLGELEAERVARAAA